MTMKTISKNPKKKQPLLMALCLCSLPLLAAGYMRFEKIFINTSDSLPAGVYKMTESNDIKRHDIVLSCLDEKHAKQAFNRGYISFGMCTDGTRPVGKHVVGLHGDHVRISEKGIFINSRLVDYTSPLTKDEQGRALKNYNLDRILQNNEFVLAGYNERSYDSRYFGPVKQKNLIGKIKSLYTV